MTFVHGLPYMRFMSDLVRILRLELASIEADATKLEAEAAKVQARLRQMLDKADKVKAVLSVYASDEPEITQPHLFTSEQSLPDQSSMNVKLRGASKAAQIKMEVTHLLEARGTEHRQKILEHLISKGLMGQEKNPLANLAAYLSDNKALFVADGRGNFSLRRESHREPPPAPISGAGSAEEMGSPPPSTFSDVQAKGGVS